jgi:hypothetical protein
MAEPFPEWPRPLSTTGENEADATLENEATDRAV